MKKKLAIAFTLIALSLSGVIIFQGYWTVNAYRVNKKQFDTDIDSALLRAMDDCKKDYFDSIRRVMIARLSSHQFHVNIDTITNQAGKVINYEISFGIKASASQSGLEFSLPPAQIIRPPGNVSNSLVARMNYKISLFSAAMALHHNMARDTARQATTNKFKAQPFRRAIATIGSGGITFNEPLSLTESSLSYYKRKIVYKDTTSIPALITEACFYIPSFLDRVLFQFSMADMSLQLKESMAYNKAHRNIPEDTLMKYHPFRYTIGVNALPPNFRLADSLRIARYLKAQLLKANINVSFQLAFTDKSNPVKTFSAWRSETIEYPYKYHGFVFLQHNNRDVTYTRAVFNKPQYAVMQGMFVNLLLSLLLILLTGFCFFYVYNTIIEQKKLADLKDDFINNMTHELKTPIATITVAIEGLQSFNALSDPEKTHRYLETSREQLNRLNQLVTKVLNIAAFENKEVELQLAEINIDEQVDDLIRMEKLKVTKPVIFSYANAGGIKTVHADLFHFRNVLLNLVDNAIKYSGDAVSVDIRVFRLSGMTGIAVKDNGIGIAQGDLVQVFDKFYRVPAGNVHNVKGTGLGLSYIKYIVEAHGGMVSATSIPGTGSEFIIALPN